MTNARICVAVQYLPPAPPKVDALRVLVCANNLAFRVSKKGRVIVFPTLKVREESVSGPLKRRLVMQAQTAPRPGWKRPRASEGDIL